MPPEVIAGRYRVEREIGRGGMGSVWLCRDERLGRDVAAKQVGGLPGESSMHLARALREARHSAALNHPNVVAIYDALEEGDHVWLVMEYVASRTLDQIVREDGPLPAARAAALLADVADGLAAAHALGTVHRDVKPSNILVREEDGRALIADFGIARTVGQEQLTRSGLVTGTPAYFAPELARGGEPSPASDVWALGVSLYVALEGRSPYVEQANALAMLNTIAHQPPPEATGAGPLAEPLRRMLDPDPETRWTMQEAAVALREAATSAPAPEPAVEAPTQLLPPEPPTRTPTTPVPVPAPTPEPEPAPPARGRGAALVLALVVLVAAVAVGGWWLTRDDGDDDPVAASDSPTQSSGPAKKPSRTPKASATTDPEPTQSSESPAAETSSAATSDAPASEGGDGGDGGDAAELVADYYGALPEDTDTSWAMLGPDLQAEVGRGGYDGFWATIDDVSVDDVTADGDVVTVTLTYTTDGRTEQETRELTVQDGLITADSGAV